MSSRIPHLTVVIALCLGSYAGAQTQVFARPQARILKSVDESATVALRGNVHPLAAVATGSSAAEFSTPMQHMILYLNGDATQEAQLTQLIAAQHDARSPLYHKFLSPQTFGSQFGVDASDLSKVTAWLQSHGFQVEQMPAGNRAIVFSGTSAQVASAFKTEIRQYTVGGAQHLANSDEPQIPAALAGAVGGVVRLNDFRHSANLLQPKALTSAQVANPQYTGGSGHYLSPSDYGIIYNINPLYTAGINGTGQTIAVLARSNIYLSDVQSFRSFSGLPANNPQIVLTSTDPGVLQGDSVETTLDAEWAGAVAPKATIKVIVGASTNSADGIDLAALYAVNNNIAPVISLSYGSCEAWMGSGGLAFYNSLWKQAAAQGQSVFVSSGDSGAAGCDGGSASSGRYGQAVNGLCSSPYATCVGGTQFTDTTNPGQYWLPGNNGTNGSAISYIPEAAWNESGSNGGSGLWSGGGGASITYPKPAWQTGAGVPADGKRDVPDISMAAAGHDGYLIWLYGGLNSVGGTSAAAPAFAGLMALVDQKMGTRQGLANSTLYPLAATQASGGTAIFHDITVSNNTVPGVRGFAATAGYDLATGIGTVDANMLVNHWGDGAANAAASLSLSASATSLSVQVGKSATSTITANASAALKAAVAMTVTGAPAGLTATLASASIAAPGSGTDVLTVAASTSTAAGTYTLTVTGTGGGKTAQVTITVVIATPTFTLASSVGSVTAMAGNTVPVTVTVTPANGFNTAVALTLTGLPTGVTGTFSSPTIAAAGGSSGLTLNVAKTTRAGSYPLAITASGGGVTQTTTVTLVVTVPASCTLMATPASVQVTAGGTPVGVNVTCGSPQGTFNGPLALTVAGAPSGMTAQLNNGTLTPGASGTLTISPAITMAGGSYNLALTASGSGFTQTISVPVTVAAVNSFSIAAGPSALAVKAGTSGTINVISTLVNQFNAAVSVGVTGLPSGVSASWSRSTLAAPGSGTAALTLTVSSSAKAGTYSLMVAGWSGSVVRSAPVTLIIPATQDFTYVANVSTLSMAQGGKATVVMSSGDYTGGLGQINISFSGLAPGMNWAVTGATAANNKVNISYTFSAATYTPVGTYQLTITATALGGGVSHSVTLPVTITAPASQSRR